MARRNSLSGGFFIMLGALAGAAIGMVSGALLPGAVAGTLIGVAAALIVWLIDRRR